MLPDAIRTAGAIKFASSFDYPPSDFLSSGGGYEGIEPDILNAAAQVLGVKIDFTHIQGFASLIPAATSGRVDMAGESIAVLPDRLKQVSFVKYGLLTDGLLVPKGNPKHITTDNLCGLSISNESGSEEVGLYDGISKKCVAAGKKPIDNQTYSTEAAQVLAVQTGRADASGFAYPNGAYIASTSKGKFEMAPGPAVDNQKLPVGFVVPKNAAGTQLGQALAAALQVLQSNGTLAKIFTKWNLPTNTIGLGFQSS
jgi:polar amino acid transport system substrate-binding protein